MRKLERSRQLQQRAEQLLPGGVDSPVRAFRAVGGDPPFVVRAEGAYLWDADGNRYIDYFGSWGPMILGHAFPPVVAAIQQAAARSASFGASTATEADLAEVVTAAVPSIEKLRFVSSGTEATMSAIRLARAFAKRKYIIKFEGCYHGHADGLLVKAGSGVATFGIPGSAGVPEEIAHFTLALPYNDIAAVEAAFAARPNEIAAVILEPVAGNMGCVPPEPGYLAALREITTRKGALLIFDEVMTGFRVALGGVQEVEGVVPDLITTAKGIAGGLPLAAVTGRAEIMDAVHSGGLGGTYGGNPVACAAALGAIETMETQDLPGKARRIGEIMLPRLQKLAETYPTIAEVRGRGAMIAIELTKPGTLEPAPATAAAVAAACHKQGLIVLTCGTFGNVLRFLPPLVIGEDLLEEGLDIIENAFAAL